MICVILLAGLVQGCGKKIVPNDLEPTSEINLTESDLGFYNLNFNPAYSGGSSEGKGYLLYDDINFNHISFNGAKIKAHTIIFDILYNDQKLQTLNRGIDNKFPSFRFMEKGEYSVNIAGKKKDDKNFEWTLKINVISGGRPDKIDYTIKDGQGRVVENTKGGEDYTFQAKIYSDNDIVSLNSSDYYWEKPSNVGILEYSFTPGNIILEEIRPFNFYCFVTNNSDEKINIASGDFYVNDNLARTEEYPDGVYYDYGLPLENKIVSLNVNTAPGNEEYFYNNITVEYRFENGDVVSLEKSDLLEEGNFRIFISYNDENYSQYSLKDYDYNYNYRGARQLNYYDNGVKYQFDPTKQSAKIYLMIWQKVQFEGGYKLSLNKAESTSIDINLVSEAPSSIQISAVKGSHKNDTQPFLTSYKEFSKPPINDAAEVYLCCHMTKQGDVTDEYRNKSLNEIKQYFIFDIDVCGGTLSDYIVELFSENYPSPVKLMTYEHYLSGKLDRYFVAIEEGIVRFTVRSRFSSASREIEIKVVNKVFDSERRIESDNCNCIGIFSTVDFRPFVKIREYRLTDLDKYSFKYRPLRDNEDLEYYLNDTLTAAEGFSALNNGESGQMISVALKNSSIKKLELKAYIIPEFSFSLFGETYSIESMQDRLPVSQNVKSSSDSRKSEFFYGYIPCISINLPEGELVNEASFSFLDVDEGFNYTYANISIYEPINEFTITYELTHRDAWNSFPKYKVPILKVYII